MANQGLKVFLVFLGLLVRTVHGDGKVSLAQQDLLESGDLQVIQAGTERRAREDQKVIEEPQDGLGIRDCLGRGDQLDHPAFQAQSKSSCRS